MTTTPDPKIVSTEETAVVDFALPLNVTKVATVFYAYDEQDESWEGAGFFAHLDTALWTTARTYADEQYGHGEMPPASMTWRKRYHLWHLYDGDVATDVVVSDSPLLGTKPDEQPQDEPCPCGCPTVGNMCDCGPDPCGCSPNPGCAFCDSPNDPPRPKQPQAEREPLRTEYGIRADFTDTTSAEFTVADNLGDALEALAEFDAKSGDRVVSRKLVQRPVGEWREDGDGRG